jgi:hypothetical protein
MVFLHEFVVMFLVLNMICLTAGKLLQSYGFSEWLTESVYFAPELLFAAAFVVLISYACIEHYVLLPRRISRGHEPGQPNYVLDVYVGDLLALRAAGNGLDPICGYVHNRFGLAVDRDLLRLHLDKALLTALHDQLEIRHRHGASWLDIVTWLKHEHGFSGSIGDLRRELYRVDPMDMPISRLLTTS